MNVRQKNTLCYHSAYKFFGWFCPREEVGINKGKAENRGGGWGRKGDNIILTHILSWYTVFAVPTRRARYQSYSGGRGDL